MEQSSSFGSVLFLSESGSVPPFVSRGQKEFCSIWKRPKHETKEMDSKNEGGSEKQKKTVRSQFSCSQLMHARRWVHSVENGNERQKGKTENRFDFIPFTPHFVDGR